MHLVEAFKKGSRTTHLAQLSEKAFGSALGIRHHFGQSVSLWYSVPL